MACGNICEIINRQQLGSSLTRNHDDVDDHACLSLAIWRGIWPRTPPPPGKPNGESGENCHKISEEKYSQNTQILDQHAWINITDCDCYSHGKTWLI